MGFRGSHGNLRSLEIEDRPHPGHQRHRSLIDMEVGDIEGLYDFSAEASPSVHPQPSGAAAPHPRHKRHLSMGGLPQASPFRDKPPRRSSTDMHICLNANAGMDGAGGFGPSDLDVAGEMLSAASAEQGREQPEGGRRRRSAWGVALWVLGIAGWVLAAGLLIAAVVPSRPPPLASTCALPGSAASQPQVPLIPDSQEGGLGGGRGGTSAYTPGGNGTIADSGPTSPASAHGCSRGRSRPLHGSGAAMCYEGHLGAVDFAGPGGSVVLPGDGACLACIHGSDSPSACLACHEGFVLTYEDPQACSGRCVLASRMHDSIPNEVPPHCSKPPEALPGHCRASHDAPVLCYDHLYNCRHDVQWDEGLCLPGAVGERACRASCNLCSASEKRDAADPHLRSILLHWRDKLPNLGPESPITWGWNADVPVHKWPGIVLSDGLTGGFVNSMNLAEFSIKGPLSSVLAEVFRPDFRMDWFFQRNSLSGTLPPEFSRILGHLKYLDLSRNALSGTVPMEWAAQGITTLPTQTQTSETLFLNLGNNRLYGTIQPQWFSQGPLSSTIGLNLENNGFEGSLPAQWSRLHPDLQEFNLQGNRISGTLPPEYSTFANLWILRLADNRLGGTLPPEYSTMADIEAVNLQGNSISGRLPSEWGNTMHAWNSVWNIADNGLTGSIPPQWSQMDMLQLELQGNGLTGALPTWLVEMTGLVELDLSNNNFNGRLPESWSRLTSLRRLKLANNSLSGPVPKGWSALVHLDSLDLRGNSGLEGGVVVGEGVFVQTAGTSLEWDGTAHATWARHRGRWESAAAADAEQEGDGSFDGGPPSGGSWRQDGQCSFCQRLPGNADKCECVRKCCRALGDRSLCSQDFDRILGLEGCPDPCSYCWSLQSAVDRSACFHSCCIGQDDDDPFPLRSDSCGVFHDDYYYYYDYDGDY